MSKLFIDTNILVYALDVNEKEKQAQSRYCLKTVLNGNRGVISTQVIQEFHVTAIRKLGVDPLISKEIIHSFSKFEIVLITPEIIDRAIDCQIINRLSFWDALIMSAAESAHCETIWTEDLNDGQIIQGIRVENPLLKLSSS